ncbi:hypothetical protein [Flavonifractor sp. An9]|uniref:hypothetical protein n=1 Tax=Flavonifractor sp. An9 TaxID=1965664 RepID=UPI000B3751C2|nr:hypothetical protein [Flavonifractor sp. An9]OUN09107.1 hypothetical protein B5G40_13650 [Flavonifractor sp. An9]
MDEKKNFWPVLAQVIRAVIGYLGLYLDDLLLIAGGGCFVQAAFDLGGRPAALATAGVCLTVYAVVVARSRGGGRK